MQKFWMCLVEGTSGCSQKHYNRTEAMEEAERLLCLPHNTGKRVYLLETVDVCCIQRPPVVWDNLPT